MICHGKCLMKHTFSELCFSIGTVQLIYTFYVTSNSFCIGKANGFVGMERVNNILVLS